MSATGERIEIVGVDDGEDESMAGNSVCLGDDVPRFTQSYQFVGIRASCAEYAREDRTLYRTKEETGSAEECEDRKDHERHPRRLVHGDPNDCNCDEPDGEERNDRSECGEGREIDFAALCSHHIIQPALRDALWSRF